MNLKRERQQIMLRQTQGILLSSSHSQTSKRWRQLLRRSPLYTRSTSHLPSVRFTFTLPLPTSASTTISSDMTLNGTNTIPLKRRRSCPSLPGVSKFSASCTMAASWSRTLSSPKRSCSRPTASLMNGSRLGIFDTVSCPRTQDLALISIC